MQTQVTLQGLPPITVQTSIPQELQQSISGIHQYKS